MHRPERRGGMTEKVFQCRTPILVSSRPPTVNHWGDFNCVLHPTDITGHFKTSGALTEIVRGFALQDAWNQNPSRPIYTYHSSHGTTRLDRFYIPTELQQQKTGIGFIPVASTDHNAVAIRIKIHDTDLKR